MIISVGSHIHWPESLLTKHGLEPAPRRWAPAGLDGIQGPSARLAIQKRDGIDAEVLVHSGYPALTTLSHDRRATIIRDFNSWIADFAAHDSSRLAAIGELPFWDTDAAVQEAKRIAKLGLRGVIIPAVPGRQGPWSPPASGKYGDAAYTSLWRELEDNGMALVVHSEVQLIGGQPTDIKSMVDMVTSRGLPSETATSLITGHVFENYPGLKLVCIESGVSWMAQTMDWLDNLVREHPAVFPDVRTNPSAQFRDHVFGTIAWDLTDSEDSNEFQMANLLWTSDAGSDDHTRLARINRVRDNLQSMGRNDILARNAVSTFRLKTPIV